MRALPIATRLHPLRARRADIRDLIGDQIAVAVVERVAGRGKQVDGAAHGHAAIKAPVRHAAQRDRLRRARRLRRGLVDRTAAARADLQRTGARLSLPLLSSRLDRARERLAGLGRLHGSLDPDRVLQRGYVRVTAPDGRTLTSRAVAGATSAASSTARLLVSLTLRSCSIHVPTTR